MAARAPSSGAGGLSTSTGTSVERPSGIKHEVRVELRRAGLAEPYGFTCGSMSEANAGPYLVTTVDPAGAAHQILAVADEIVAINGKSPHSHADLLATIRQHDVITLTLIRLIKPQEMTSNQQELFNASFGGSNNAFGQAGAGARGARPARVKVLEQELQNQAHIVEQVVMRHDAMKEAVGVLSSMLHSTRPMPLAVQPVPADADADAASSLPPRTIIKALL